MQDRAWTQGVRPSVTVDIDSFVLNMATDLRRSDDTVVEAGNYLSPSPSICCDDSCPVR